MRLSVALLSAALFLASCGGGAVSPPPVSAPAAPLGAPNAGTPKANAVAKNYIVVDLGANVTPTAINNNNQVVGFASFNGTTQPVEAFLYSGGKLHNLGTLPGSTGSYASGINDSGTIIGTATAGVNQTAALFFANASPRSLGTGNGVASSGASVNNAGELVGTVFSSTDGSSTSCYNQIAIFDGHGGAQQFASNALAVAVNSSGTILYDIYNGISLNCREGTISVAEYPSNAVVPFPANAANDNGTSGGNGINDLGDVVGFYRDSNFNNAGFYYHNGTSTELLLTGYSFTAWGINNNEVIVGTATPSGPGNTRAYAWSNGTFTDLNTRLAAGCQQWSILTAHAINTQGYIVGTALLNNQLHGVMLVPQ